MPTRRIPAERAKVTVAILDRDLRADALRVTAARQVHAERPVGRRAGDRGDRPAARGHHPHPRPRPAARRDRRIRPTLARKPSAMASRFNPLKADAHWQKVWDEARHLPRVRRQRPAQGLCPGDVPLSVGAHPYGPCPQLHDGRRARPLPADERASRCSTRWAGTRSACRPRMRRWSARSIPANGPGPTSRR